MGSGWNVQELAERLAKAEVDLEVAADTHQTAKDTYHELLGQYEDAVHELRQGARERLRSTPPRSKIETRVYCAEHDEWTVEPDSCRHHDTER